MSFLIGQEGPPTEAELDLLNNNKFSEMVRVYRKWISFSYAQKAAMLVKAKPEELQKIQGQMIGLTEAWNLPFQAQVLVEQMRKQEKKLQDPLVNS